MSAEGDLLLFVVVVLVMGSYGYWRTLRERDGRHRVETFLRDAPPGPRYGIFGLLGEWVGRRLAESRSAEEVRIRLIHAGLERMKPAAFVALRWAAVLLFALLGLAVRGWVLGLLGALFGGLLPGWILGLRMRQRLGRVEAQLSDVMDLISNSLRAGNSTMQAIQVVSREVPDPVGAEFALMAKAARFGDGLEEGCRTLLERVPSPDLRMFVTALLIHRQIGGNLAEIMSTLSRTIRERTELRGQVRTLTAQGRFSAMFVGLIPPGLLLLFYLTNPHYISVEFTTTLGRVVLVLAVLLEGAAFLWMRQIVAVDF